MTDYAPDLHHLALLAAKAETIDTARISAEEQLIHRLACEYSNGSLDAGAVYSTFAAARGSAARGFAKRWDARMPHELQTKRIIWTAVKYAPDPDGNWRGIYPFASETKTPAPGSSVVYVLFDDENRPCYVGSTEQFRIRMNAHHSAEKRFTQWIAHPCRDRETAFVIEERLLAEHQPYLNRKPTR